MDGADFEDLLTGEMSAAVRWQSATPCPCVDPRGALDRSCPLCFGLGNVYSDVSAVFRCGLVGQSAKVRAAMAQMMGPAVLGASTLVLPYTAPCYREIREGDRIWDQRVEDRYRLILTPKTKFALPYGFRDLTAQVRSDDHTKLVFTQPPPLMINRVAEVSVPTTISFLAPRGYEVVPELSQVRSFGEGIPRRLGLNRLDASMRSARAAQTIGG